jgi:hypothetical protein
MTNTEINALLALIGVTPIDIARAIEEDRSSVSATLNLLRINKRLRLKIAKHVAELVERRLFDERPAQSPLAQMNAKLPTV